MWYVSRLSMGNKEFPCFERRNITKNGSFGAVFTNTDDNDVLFFDIYELVQMISLCVDNPFVRMVKSNQVCGASFEYGKLNLSRRLPYDIKLAECLGRKRMMTQHDINGYDYNVPVINKATSKEVECEFLGVRYDYLPHLVIKLFTSGYLNMAGRVYFPAYYHDKVVNVTYSKCVAKSLRILLGKITMLGGSRY